MRSIAPFMRNLSVITPCSRPENLVSLAASLTEAKELFDVRWHVVHDCRSGECGFPLPDFVRGHLWHRPSKGLETAGHAQMNHALDRITDGLVWRLDDDNLPVPGFFKRLAELEAANPAVDLFLFGQLAAGRYDEAKWPGGVVHPIPEVGLMDSAQFVFRREVLGALRFQADDYKADGHFIEALHGQVGSTKTWIEPGPLTAYNALARKENKMPHFYKEISGFFHCEPLYKRVVEEAKDGAVFVEVGVWRGQSAAYMGVEIANSGKRITLHAVDSFTGTADGRSDSSVANHVGQLDAARFNSAKRVLAPVSDHVKVVRGMSADVATRFADGSLDFVFLDADHTEAGCRADILAWLPKGKPGGLLAGDDYCHPEVGDGVRNAVDALLPGAVVPERFEDHVSGWWEYRVPERATEVVLYDGPLVKTSVDHFQKISVVTPLHVAGNRFVLEAYESLCHQTERDWEWVVLENSGGHVPEKIREDRRVRVMRDEPGDAGDTPAHIGALKRRLCAEARAPFVIELDCDDVLRPDALELVLAEFDVPGRPDFVYSDFAEFRDGTLEPNTPYRADCGWGTYPMTFRGKPLLAHRAPPATPQNCRWVDWAPNHVRAWRAAAYREVGGHDPRLAVADDHDLVVRFLLAGKVFRHVPLPLYFYRVHADNTVGARNAEIRAQVDRNYEKYRWALAQASGHVWVGRDTSCRVAMAPGEWLFLRCPRADWYDRSAIPLLKGDLAVSRLVERDGEVLADLIRLGEGYEHMGPLGGD